MVKRLMDDASFCVNQNLQNWAIRALRALLTDDGERTATRRRPQQVGGPAAVDAGIWWRQFRHEQVAVRHQSDARDAVIRHGVNVTSVSKMLILNI